MRALCRDLVDRPPSNFAELVSIWDQLLMTVALQDEPEAHVRMPLMLRTDGLCDGQEKRSFADPGGQLRFDAQLLAHFTPHGVHRILTLGCPSWSAMIRALRPPASSRVATVFR
jgi:hypothetical protein